MISEECNDWAGVYKVQTFGTTHDNDNYDNNINMVSLCENDYTK